MGSFSMSIPDELTQQLSKHLNIFDKVAPKMLQEAAPIVKEKIKKRAPQKTGQLIKSVTVKKPKRTKTGAYISMITFDGVDKKTGVPNHIKAAVEEFGKSGQEARPFVRPAVADAEPEVLSKMQEVFNKEVEG